MRWRASSKETLSRTRAAWFNAALLEKVKPGGAALGGCGFPPNWRTSAVLAVLCHHSAGGHAPVPSPTLAEERGTPWMCPSDSSALSPPPNTFLQEGMLTPPCSPPPGLQAGSRHCGPFCTLPEGRACCLRDGEMAASLHRPYPFLPEAQPGEDLGGRHDGDILQQMPFHC